jgi:hypothetical protein
MKIQDMKIQGDGKGRYESPFADYPGFIAYPYPITETHFKKWWEVAIDPIKNASPLQLERFDYEWNGAKFLLSEFGQWGIDGVAIGEVKAGNCPLEVKEWATDCAVDYIFPKLSPRHQRRLTGL